MSTILFSASEGMSWPEAFVYVALICAAAFLLYAFFRYVIGGI